MGEDYIPKVDASKQEKYDNVHQQLEERIEGGHHPLSDTSNLLALLKMEFQFLWVGYYFVKKQTSTLELGQFQGPPACPTLFKGSGVCSKAWEQEKTIVVKDVNDFEGHIACSSSSKSQIVVPIISKVGVLGVLDIDSDKVAAFDEVDQKELEGLLKMIPFQQWEWFISKNH